MNEKELAKVTRETAEKLFGGPGKQGGAYPVWKSFDPELARHISMFYTGRMYARDVLTQRERELCAVGALTVRGFWDELYLHCHAARNVGATKQEIAEVIFQMGTYGGAPCTVEGLKVFRKVLEERGEWEEPAA